MATITLNGVQTTTTTWYEVQYTQVFPQPTVGPSASAGSIGYGADGGSGASKDGSDGENEDEGKAEGKGEGVQSGGGRTVRGMEAVGLGVAVVWAVVVVVGP